MQKFLFGNDYTLKINSMLTSRKFLKLQTALLLSSTHISNEEKQEVVPPLVTPGRCAHKFVLELDKISNFKNTHRRSSTRNSQLSGKKLNIWIERIQESYIELGIRNGRSVTTSWQRTGRHLAKAATNLFPVLASKLRPIPFCDIVQLPLIRYSPRWKENN